MPVPRVQWLKEDHDLAGLEKILRNRADPALRMEAAQALGSLDDLEAVEPLARAVLQDPDQQVQQAARRALANLVGAETETVIATYRHHLSINGTWQTNASTGKDDEVYLLDTPVASQAPGEGESPDAWADTADGADQAPFEEEWDQQNLDGMIAVLSHETNPKIRLQAIQALQNSSNMRAIEALSTIALDEENAELSQAARAALEKRFGEGAGDIIESYRRVSENEEDFSEIEDSEDEQPEDAEAVYQGPVDTPRSTSTFGNFSSSPVIQEDHTHWRLVLLVILVLLIVGGVAYVLLSR
jgi:hypothetical protein